MRPLRTLLGSIAVFSAGFGAAGAIVLSGPPVLEAYLGGPGHPDWLMIVGSGIGVAVLSLVALFTGPFILGMLAAITTVDESQPRVNKLLSVGACVGAGSALVLVAASVTGVLQAPGFLPLVDEPRTAVLSGVVAAMSSGLYMTVWRAQDAGTSSHRDPALSAAEIRQVRVSEGDFPPDPGPWEDPSVAHSQFDATTAEEHHIDESSDPSLTDSEYDWQTETDVCFDDVGGMDDIKARLERDVITPLTSDHDVVDTFDIPVSNILFHGPPGTGKSFLATALAGEVGLPFVALSGQDVTSKYINESATKVRTLFDEARALAQSHGGAVIFLDEIDAVLATRDASHAHAEDSKVVTEFLSQLQTVGESDSVVVIGATNRLDVLDRAAIRNGRFDETIHIGPPDEATRVAMLQAQLAARPATVTDDELQSIASKTEGLVAADLASIVIDAARIAAYERTGEAIKGSDLLEALDDYIDSDSTDRSKGFH